MKKIDYSVISKIGFVCFYMAIITEVFLVIIDKSNYTNPIEGRLFQLTFILCLLKVCTTRYTVRECVTIFLFCALGAVSYFVTGRNEILRLVMMIAACKNVDMIKCLKVVFWLTFAGCVAIVLLSVTGIYGTVLLTMDFGRGGVESRYALGMGHPNALHCMVWALTTLGLYLYGDKLKWYHYILALVMNIGVFFLSFSRTSLLVGLFTIAMSYLTSGKRREKVKKICAYLGAAAMLGSVLLSVFIAANAYRVYNYDWHRFEEHDAVTKILVRINNILNGRIRMLTGSSGWEGSISSWSLFSKSGTEYYFDMGWVRLFYWYGIIPACVFTAVLLVLIIFCYRKKQYLAITLIAAFSVYTIIEAHAISQYLARNYIFFLIGMYWWRMLQKSQWQKGGVNEEDINCQ
ncbi:MAG: hypothetical protein HDR02_00125 [Lachnospiraceae bacterium]|nr:hypothetical protein [Lachnospiraceae bacterium]